MVDAPRSQPSLGDLEAASAAEHERIMAKIAAAGIKPTFEPA